MRNMKNLFVGFCIIKMLLPVIASEVSEVAEPHPIDALTSVQSLTTDYGLTLDPVNVRFNYKFQDDDHEQSIVTRVRYKFYNINEQGQCELIQENTLPMRSLRMGAADGVDPLGFRIFSRTISYDLSPSIREQMYEYLLFINPVLCKYRYGTPRSTASHPTVPTGRKVERTIPIYKRDRLGLHKGRKPQQIGSKLVMVDEFKYEEQESVCLTIRFRMGALKVGGPRIRCSEAP